MAEDYIDKLRAVFDLCDVERKGYISVEHFVGLAKDHFGAQDEGEEDINKIIGVLDPEGDGQIHFEEFCDGVKQILELKSPSSPVIDWTHPRLASLTSEHTVVPEDEDANSCGNSRVADSIRRCQLLWTHDTSELSTFNEYDMMTDDDAGTTSTHPEGATSPSEPISVCRPHNHSEEDEHDSAISDNRREVEVTDEDEKYEDYGEMEDLDSETEIGRNVNRSLPLQLGGNRRVTTSALASHLYKPAGSSADHSRRSSCSDDIFDNIDESFVELNDKVQKLENQVVGLQENQKNTDERHTRMKDENVFFVERIHLLEEQLREVELRSHELIAEEQKKHREIMSKTDREKTQEIDLLTQSLQHIEKEYQCLKEEAPRLRAENEKLKREQVYSESKLNEAQQQLVLLSDEHKETQTRYQEDRNQMEQERKVNAQLLDELSKELEELRSFKLEVEAGRKRGRSSSVELPRSQRKELEAQIIRLKEEVSRLREVNDELQAHMLSTHVREGRKLLQTDLGTSLAEEIENLPRDEEVQEVLDLSDDEISRSSRDEPSTLALMKALRDQQEINMKLRNYVDSMTLRILEKNPSLLEIPINRKS